MNVLARNVRGVTNIVSDVYLRNGSLGSVMKHMSIKSNLPFKWVKPEKIPCTMPEKSGDGGIDLKISENDLMNHYEKSNELQDADEIVKRMFTLKFVPKQETKNKKRELTLATVQRHKADRGSMESKIAAMTSEILHLQEAMETHSKNVMLKVFLKELIDKRKKYLGLLRTWDYKRFEWLLEKLNLVYKPNPALAGKITRKRSLRALTKLHCIKIRREKMKAYSEELKAQQGSFFVEKAEKLEFIRNEEIACGREPTVTEEEIAVAKEVAQKFKEVQPQN